MFDNSRKWQLFYEKLIIEKLVLDRFIKPVTSPVKLVVCSETFQSRFFVFHVRLFFRPLGRIFSLLTRLLSVDTIVLSVWEPNQLSWEFTGILARFQRGRRGRRSSVDSLLFVADLLLCSRRLWSVGWFRHYTIALQYRQHISVSTIPVCACVCQSEQWAARSSSPQEIKRKLGCSSS